MAVMEILSLVFSVGITSSSLQIVLDRIAKFVEKNIELFKGLDVKLNKLGRTLLKIQALVDDVEKEQCIPEACCILLEDLKNVIFDADDLLDKIDFEIARRNSGHVPTTNGNQVRDLIPFNSNIPSDIEEKQKQLDELVRELEGYFVTEIIKFRQHSQTLSTPHSCSLVDESSVIGRHTDKDKIIKMVLSVEEEGEKVSLIPNVGMGSIWRTVMKIVLPQEEEGENVSLIPIVGMGGIGKTTLAQLVYNDPVVNKKFDLKMWVPVSIDYDVHMITKCIIESATEQAFEFLNLDTIQIILQKILRGKKFLLVLDGMWNENLKDWDVLRLPFRAAKQGSKIVMTTRSETVSLIVSPTPVCHLPPLLTNDCWEIIKKGALLSTNLDGHREVAEKCKGLPLAAKVIGSVLRFKTGEMEWNTLLKHELRELVPHKNQIYPVLKLSYDNLPAYLKRCFTYCSVFPHNYKFEKDDLVRLWAAEGFIQAQGTKEIEDIGKEYFDDLCSRSFFQISKVVTMHALIHDLARLVSTNLCFCMEDTMSCSLPMSTNVRHSSLLHQNIQPSTLEDFYRYEKLRTFMLNPESASNLNRVPEIFFERLQCLRVLNLSHSVITDLSEFIAKLIHLRYLNLSNTLIEKLPYSIAYLYRLETLKLKNCCKLLELPENLKNLVKLRHLDFDRHRQISFRPKEVGKLTSLENLHAFIVGKGEGYRIEELQNMRCLRGSICIKNLANVADCIEAETAMLGNKQYLEELELQWNEIEVQRVDDHQQVLTGLKPHVWLQKLKVTGYYSSVFPNWIADSSFCKLVSIDLKKCEFCTLLPSLGQLPALKYLLIQEMHTLENVDALFCGSAGDKFPSLETLKFCDMKKLRVWSRLSENDMPRLKELCIDTCPVFETLPSVHYLISLETLNIHHCSKLQSFPLEGPPVSLISLIISESDILKRRCKVGGEDWGKIKFIPNIMIDDEDIPILQNRDIQVDEIQGAPQNMFCSRNFWLTICAAFLSYLLLFFMANSLSKILLQDRN